MSKSTALKHYKAAIAQWPADVLRPETSFTNAMHNRIQRRFRLPSKSGTSPATQQTTLVANEATEMEQVNALYSFLENRYMKRYSLSSNMMKPKSNPMHYENLLREIDDAPKRSRFGSWLNSWKGFFRWK